MLQFGTVSCSLAVFVTFLIPSIEFLVEDSLVNGFADDSIREILVFGSVCLRVYWICRIS